MGIRSSHKSSRRDGNGVNLSVPRGGLDVLVLDTDLVSILYKGPPMERTALRDWLRRANDNEVSVTIVSFEEQVRGWMAAIAKAKAPQQQVPGYRRLHELLDDYEHL